MALARPLAIAALLFGLTPIGCSAPTGADASTLIFELKSIDGRSVPAFFGDGPPEPFAIVADSLRFDTKDFQEGRGTLTNTFVIEDFFGHHLGHLDYSYTLSGDAISINGCAIGASCPPITTWAVGRLKDDTLHLLAGTAWSERVYVRVH